MPNNKINMDKIKHENKINNNSSNQFYINGM